MGDEIELGPKGDEWAATAISQRKYPDFTRAVIPEPGDFAGGRGIDDFERWGKGSAAFFAALP